MSSEFDYAALPDSVLPFISVLRRTERVSFEVRLLDEMPASPAASRVGGWPYGIGIDDYPLAEDGTPLAFLAQLNLGELTLPPEAFPSTGLLLFFGDDGRGQVPPSGKVIHLPTVPAGFVFPDAASRTRSARPGPGQWGLIDEAAQYAITGFLRWTPAPGDTLSVAQLFLDAADVAEDPFAVEDAHDAYTAEEFLRGHRVGGYAHYNQERPDEVPGRILLFQLDSDPWEPSSAYRVLLGDLGTARFFIHRDALVRGDFSAVEFDFDNG